MKRLQLLEELTNAPGIPGYECDVRRCLAKAIGDTAEIAVDPLGNLICTKTGDPEGPRIMLPSHMDEIGFMVNRITDEGFIKFVPLGGWWDQVMLAQRVRVRGRIGWVQGIVGSKPPHILNEEEAKKVVQKDAMFIDVGAKDKAEVEKSFGIRPGDPVVPVCDFEILQNQHVVLAKALDDRAGCAALVELLQRLNGVHHPNSVFAVGTIQEEVGLRGARTASHSVNPDVCIALDVGVAGDMPGVTDDESSLRLGGGPVLYLADHSVIAHQGLRSLVMEAAEAENVPLQFSTLMGGGTDAGAVHLHARGVPSLTLGVPVRYVHSSAGLMDLVDYDHLVRLLEAVIVRLDWTAVNNLVGGDEYAS